MVSKLVKNVTIEKRVGKSFPCILGGGGHLHQAHLHTECSAWSKSKCKIKQRELIHNINVDRFSEINLMC